MIEFNKKRIFNITRNIPELEEIISELKKFMYERYYVDYLGIHVIDKDSRYMISRLDHQAWHDYYWEDSKVTVCPSMQQLTMLGRQQQIILFFQTYQSRFLYEARDEIIGKVNLGSSILMGDQDTGNRIQFCITFQDGLSIDCLNVNILMSLVKDLNNYKTILNPFMEYFTKVGNLNYTEDLKMFVNKRKTLIL